MIKPISSEFMERNPINLLPLGKFDGIYVEQAQQQDYSDERVLQLNAYRRQPGVGTESATHNSQQTRG